MNYEVLETKDLKKQIKEIEQAMNYEDNVHMLMMMRKQVVEINAELLRRQEYSKRR